MDERETRAMMEDVAAVMKSLVSNAVTPIVSRLEALEKRLADLPVPKDGANGKDADIEEIAALAAASLLPDIMGVRSMVEALPAPVELPDIPAMIADAVKAIPIPKDGKDTDVEEITIQVTRRPEFLEYAAEIKAIKAAMAEGVSTELFQEIKAEIERLTNLDHAPVIVEKVAEAVADAVAALPPAEKGKDADPVEVAAQIAAEVERAVAALPAPQDGKSITVEDVRPLIDEAVTKAVTLIPVPKNGVDGKDGRNGLDAVKFFRDDKGHLIAVKSDGSTDDLGEYVGKDGSTGERGKDGADGVGFDDMDLVETEQGIMLRFTRGEIVKDFRLPIVTDRGVFKEGTEYRKGDGVTWGGSFWIAQETTSEKPDIGKGFRLAVKRGRDGKDGTIKDLPKPGPVKVG